MKLELASLSLTVCGSSSLTAGGDLPVSGEGSWGHSLSRAGGLGAVLLSTDPHEQPLGEDVSADTGSQVLI